jgi:catechol 2,3-dioxygenase-like lactoylglutathione lyase family enzyme
MRLQHVGITVLPESMASAQEFYAGVLGLPLLRGSERVAIFALGGDDLELHVVAGSAPDAAAVHHFALEVEDLAAARAQLEAAGQTLGDARPVGGRERFFVRDPFGNLVELVSRPA